MIPATRIRDLVERSDREFQASGNESDQLIAADMLWGAFAQGLIAMAKIHGWECVGEDHMRDVSNRLAEMRNDTGWRQDFEAAAQLQRHFLHGHLGEEDLATARESSRRAVLELLRIIEEDGQA